MPGFVGFTELLLLGVLALVIFGPKRLPEMGRGLGKGMREFKDSITNKDDDQPTELQTTAAQAPVEQPAAPAATAPTPVERDHTQ